MNKITKLFFAGTEKSADFHHKSTVTTAPFGAVWFNSWALVLSMLVISGIAAAIAIMVYHHIGPEYLDVFKDMFRITGYILLVSTWTAFKQFILHAAVLMYDDWAGGFLKDTVTGFIQTFLGKG